MRFWEDRWAGEDSLKRLFSSLFRLSTFNNRPIADFAVHSGLQEEGYTNWNFHFSRNLLDREIIQLPELLGRLEGRQLCDCVEDKRTWLADSSGIFTCKSAFVWMRKDNSLPVNYQAKCIWKMPIPVKVKVFTWLLILGKLNVHSNLQRTKPYQALSPGWCILCKKNNESIDHLFLHCEFSLRQWFNILKEFGMEWVIPRTCTELLTLGQVFHLTKKGKTLWKVAVSATFWPIWLERNRRISMML